MKTTALFAKSALVLTAASFAIGWIAMIVTSIIGKVFDIMIFQYMSYWEVYILLWTYEILGLIIFKGISYDKKYSIRTQA